MLYKGLYECTNVIKSAEGKDNNVLYSLAKKYNVNSFGMDLIKYYRLSEQHALEKSDYKKTNKLYEFHKKVIKKSIPTKKSEYVKIQYALYEEIYAMLNGIFDNMNKPEEKID